MTRVAVGASLILLVAALLAPAAAARRPVGGDAAPAVRSWAEPQIAAVTAAGLMGPDARSFRPEDPVTKGELYAALAAIGHVTAPPADPDGVVTMKELDARLVGALDLGGAAWRFRRAMRDSGLQPTAHVGTEVVARLLGLRLNHPQTQEWLELGPNMPATRAEAAYSLARILALPYDRVEEVHELAATFTIAELSDWQRSVLTRALRLVGFPYVWAGTSERPQQLWGPGGKLVGAPAGFDCSGFVWRVFKTQPFADAPQLATVLQGRTTYAMSGEVPAVERIGIDELAPGDVVFFGSKGTASKPAEIGHMGLYVGNGWLVHSSGFGVTMVPLEGWYRTTFAWARRPLAEAGLMA